MTFFFNPRLAINARTVVLSKKYVKDFNAGQEFLSIEARYEHIVYISFFHLLKKIRISNL
jgi:hypothetical protein